MITTEYSENITTVNTTESMENTTYSNLTTEYMTTVNITENAANVTIFTDPSLNTTTGIIHILVTVKQNGWVFNYPFSPVYYDGNICFRKPSHNRTQYYKGPLKGSMQTYPFPFMHFKHHIKWCRAFIIERRISFLRMRNPVHHMSNEFYKRLSWNW